MNNQGVVYCAVGEDFLWQAEQSAASLRSYHSDINITIFTDCVVKSRLLFDNIIPIEVDRANIRDVKSQKIFAIKESPYYHSIFLDCDTFVATPIDDLFDLLQRYDLAVAYDTWRIEGSDSSLLPCQQYLNTGVISFRKTEKFNNFARSWYDLYIRYNGYSDQWPFREILYRDDIDFFVLPPEYNVRASEPVHITGPVRVLHKGYSKNPEFNGQRLIDFLNSTHCPRIYSEFEKKMICLTQDGVKVFHL